MISPVCARRPYPTVDPNSTGGNKPKNTPITISFDQVIQNPEDDLVDIDIQIAGESILSHYKTPVFTNENRTILFDADDDNLLDFTSGTRVVNVIIPDTLYYTMPDGTEVHMNSEVTSSFTIDYTTRDSAIISLEVDDAAAGKLNRTGNHTFYMGEEFTVIYTVSDGYQFGGWNVSLSEGVSGTIKEENGKVYLDDVAILEIVPNGDDFDEEYYASINKYQVIYRVLAGSRDIKINPVYYKKPIIQSISPSNKETVEKNSPIIITFSKKMDISKEELEKISITIDGLNASNYFDAPIMEDNAISGVTQITYNAKRSNLIDVPVGTKNITVSIPKSFSYLEDGQNISLPAAYIYTYSINNNTVDKIKLQFIYKPDECTLDAQSEKTLYLYDTYTVHCTPKADSEIVDWKIYKLNNNDESDDSVSIPSSILEVTPTQGEPSITLNSQSGISGTVIVKPIIKKKNFVEIKVTSDYGTTIPAGKAGTFYYGDEVSLSYREQSDYQFVGWKVNKVINKADNQPVDLDTLVKFQDTTEENGSVEKGEDKFDTILKINELTVNYVVEIKAECIRRPKIITKLPAYDTSGVNKDRKIMVMFDKKMDENSIYFTTEELISAGVCDADNTLLDAFDENGTILGKYELLNSEKNPGKVYGYCIKNGDSILDNSYVYKNITITKRIDQSENLLKHYDEPYFDELDASILRISTKSGDDVPPGATDIMVELKKEFSYIDSETNKNITLTADTSWSYYTNGDIDNKAPIANTGFKMQIFTDSDAKIEVETEYTGTSPDVYLEMKNGENFENMKKHNCKGKKVHFEGSFNDDSSGIAYIKWYLYKVNSTYYKEEQRLKEISAGQLIKGTDYELTGLTATIKNGDIGLKNEIVREGMYMFRLVVGDNNDNTLDNKYYFVYDETEPETVKNLKESRTKSGKATISWTQIPEFDIKKMTLNAINIEDSTKTKKFDIADKKSTSIEIDVVNGNHYKYELELTDTIDQSTTTYLSEDRTPPAKLTIRYSEGRNGRVIVYFTTPNDVDYYKTTVSYGDSSNPQYLMSEGTGSNVSASRTFDGASNGTTYYYYFRTYDYSGNSSGHVYLEEMGGAMPGMICYAPNSSSIFCSKNYWSGKNPIGYVCEGSNQSSVKIWDIKEEKGYCWGKTGCDPNSDTEKGWNGSADMNYSDGLTWYKEIIMQKYSYLVNFTGYDINNYLGYNPHTIWYYLEKVKNVNSAVTWYIPSPGEFKYILDNYNAMKVPYNTLKSNGITTTLVTSQQPYWTGVARYYDNYAFVGAFNTTIGGGLDWSRYHSNSNSELKYFALTSNQREAGWYYKDRAIDVANGTPYWIRTHAMAIINMN